jgi:hypothetical protein
MANNGYSRSPLLLKGALVEFSQRFLGPAPNIIIFQYNPDSLTRTLQVWDPDKKEDGGKTPGVAPTASPTVQPDDPPESFTLNLIVDATDALEDPTLHPVAFVSGVADRLAALEMLLYPEPDKTLLGGLLSSLSGSLSVGSGGVSLSGAGGGSQPKEVPPKKVPVVLFVWGPGRIVPVRLNSFVIEEQWFSPLLYPLRAKVTLGLKVLTPSDFPNPDRLSEKIAIKAFQFTRKQKQVLAAANLANSVESIRGMLPF